MTPLMTSNLLFFDMLVQVQSYKRMVDLQGQRQSHKPPSEHLVVP